MTCPAGAVTHYPDAAVVLASWTDAAALTLTLTVGGHSNAYPLWVYPDEAAEVPANVLVTADVEEALAALADGGRVLLTPPAEEARFPHGIRSQFSTDFWCSVMFKTQPGGMGLLMDTAHPIFKAFPTAKHTTWPWWQMAGGMAFEVPAHVQPVVRVMDSYSTLRHLALLISCRVGTGRLMISGMGLSEHTDRVEIRALTAAILAELASSTREPADVLTPDEVRHIVC